MSESMDVVISELSKLLKKDLIDIILSGLLPDHVTSQVLIDFFKEKINRCDESGEKLERNQVGIINSVKVLQMEIQYLRELQIQKDLVIANQAIAIEALKNHNNLLMNNNFAGIGTSINKQDQKSQQKSANITDKNARKHVKEIPSNREGNPLPDVPASYAFSVMKDININKNEQQISSYNVNEKNSPILQKSSEPGTSELVRSNNAGNSEWTEVNYRKSKRKTSRTILIGNFTGESSVQGIEKVKYLHVSNLRPDTTAEELMSFLTKQFSSNIKCEPIKSRFPESYSSFKVGIPISEYEKALLPSNWPNHASVHNFFRRKQTDAHR